MGMSQRTKGKKGEREVAKLLREHGYEDARRGVQYQGSPDSPDVTGLAGFHIEVKRTEQCRLYDYLGQAIDEAGIDELPVVFHRQNNKQWVVIMSADDFLKAVKPYADNHR